jgi:coenzyme F420 hydrogenase subunit beta
LNGNTLHDTVIKNGYCIGCGACAAHKESPFTMQYDRYGKLQASLTGDDVTETRFEEICPFGSGALDEDALAEKFLPDASQHHRATGRFISCTIGHVSDTDIRARASSGGIGRWLPAELLRQNLVDAVIHVSQNAGSTSSADLFSYTVSRGPAELLQTARSAYYPVSLDKVVMYIRQHPGRYAVTGVPCFIKALRLLSLHDDELRQRITFTIGIICGHLKSTAFAEALAWQLGVPPATLRGIEFRGKLAGKPANHKGVSAKSSVTGDWVPMKSSKQLVGGNWGLGFFKYRACDYCDDVTAETADVAIGDAWLPEFVKDSKGTSVIISRHPVIDRLLSEGRAAGTLHLLDSTPEQMARSQAGGLRHRRDGLAYRLSIANQQGQWHPPKRVAPASGHLSSRKKRMYELRVALSETSHDAFYAAKQNGDFNSFVGSMRNLMDEYEQTLVAPHKRLVMRTKTFTREQVARLKQLARRIVSRFR